MVDSFIILIVVMFNLCIHMSRLIKLYTLYVQFTVHQSYLNNVAIIIIIEQFKY